MILGLLYICLLLLYILRIGSYLAGWFLLGRKKSISADLQGITVVVAVRNEEENIALLMEDLEQQSQPGDLLEVIVVDDHSSDRTFSILEEKAGTFPALRLLKLEDNETGKKAALRKGILSASHEMIINTDGDCRVGPEWVHEMQKMLRTEGARLVVGPVFLEEGKGLFQSMQALEFISLVATAAGSAGMKRPVLCNAASLAYYREDYLEFMKEPSRSESGDDIFLMLWLKKKYPDSIRFCRKASSAVLTKPQDSVAGFIRQRLRWTSKSRYYRDAGIILTAMIVWMMSAAILASLAWGLILLFFHKDLSYLVMTGILFCGKCLVDFLLISSAAWHFGKSRLLRYFIPLEIVYFVYLSLIGIGGQFIPWSWKGRKFGNTKT